MTKTLDEIFKEVELSEEQVSKIKEGMKANSIFTASEENLDVRYGKLKTQNESTNKELEAAQKLIEETKESEKNNQELQDKITGYEEKIKELEDENTKLEIENALKVALLEADVKDIDYLAYKVHEKGEIELNDNGKIKGIEETIEELKTQHPEQFNKKAEKKIEENKLKKEDGENAPTMNDIKKMNYKDLSELKSNNPEAFKEFKEGVANGNNN